ncbi:MAG: hypothetical protein WD768_03485 [Phycisphaeraceae bacterium]
MNTRTIQHGSDYRPGLIFWAVFIFIAFAAPAFAEDKLTAQVANIGFRGRTASPAMVDITLDYTGSAVLTGQLHLIVVGLDVLADLVTGDIALVGKRQVRVMLPPIPPVVGQNMIDLELAFKSDGQVLDLGKHSLSIPELAERSFVVAVCDPLSTSIDRRFGPIATSLALELYRPENTKPGQLRTLPAMIDPTRMPTQPLGYCGYDIVLLTPESLPRLDAAQLDAILAWTQAGGSTLVITGSGAAFEDKHLDFLSALFLPGRQSRAVRLSPQGKLVFDDGRSPPAMVLARPELGRAVIVFGDDVPQEVWDKDKWRQAVAHLWKMRADATKQMINASTWGWRRAKDAGQASVGNTPGESKLLNKSPVEGRRYASDLYEEVESNPLQAHAAFDVSSITEMLMPEDVRVMPFGLVVLMLFAFVVFIGPVDYFVLGWMKRRRLTWISFPLTAVLFTWITVQMANHYMGQTGKGKAIEVIDVGTRGQVLRTTMIDLQFSPREYTLERELNGELLVPVDAGRRRGYGRRYYDEDRSSGLPPVYVGSMPGKHAVITVVRQWSPRMFRISSIGGDEPAMKFDWAGAHDAVWQRQPDPQAIRTALLADIRANAKVIVYGGAGAIAADTDIDAMISSAGRYDNGYGAPRLYEPKSGPPRLDVAGLEKFAGMDSRGLFQYVSQISPTGSDNFEDLSMYDAEDEKCRLVLLLLRDGNQITLYRRLYRSQGD